ncbi:MAG: alkaline phosphatase family protein [Microscillaceae bacterium]|nr:alkaline phosphatase family protein [Microscillaceae bacterium]
MKKTVVLNVVGLTTRLLDEKNTPFLYQWAAKGLHKPVRPVLPALTCPAQSTYLTGQWPSLHGAVANGWYFAEECEIKFWRQSNKLVQADKIWDEARRRNPGFTVANLFWWYNMYSSADYSVTPRPNYLADGRKIPDCYSYPPDLRDKLQNKLGPFPLFNFWGPNTSIKSSRWIADASLLTDHLYDPTLTLIYLPHLDYNLQRHGPSHPSIPKDLKEIDAVCADLIKYYEAKGAALVLLSEYGITEVKNPIHLNRVLRRKDLLAIRREQTWELLDAGASKAFAVADHQIAHVYVNETAEMENVRAILSSVEGVEQVLDRTQQAEFGINHARSGDFVVVADQDSWFTYYFWLDDDQAPDYARMVDIHKKPGYDPVEMFLDPKIKLPMLTVGSKLLKKKMGFRTVMDVIPLDANLIKGSHGRIPGDQADWPLLISHRKDILAAKENWLATDIYGALLEHLGLSKQLPE